MAILEHVKLLETKVIREIDLANQLIEENSQLKQKVESSEKRIADLESLIQEFREEYKRIESGILSTLTRLNHFEDAVDKGLSHDQSDAEQEKDSPDENAEPDAEESEEQAEDMPEHDAALEQTDAVTSTDAETSDSQ